MAGRPIGITIIAILQLLGALFLTFTSALAVMAAMLLGPLAFIALIIAGILLVFALIGFILFYGLWTLKGWAWMLALIINILEILIYVYQMNFMNISLFISLIVVIYLLVPGTRAAFKK